MKFTVQQIADQIGARVEGNPQAVISRFSKIDAGEEEGLSFLANPKYTHYIYTTLATAVLVGEDFKPDKELSCTLIRVKDPYLAFAQLMTFYQEQQRKTGISQFASIASSAVIGKNVYIGDFVSISEGVVIGDNVQIYPHTYIGDNVQIGHDTVLHSGVKIYHSCIIGNYCTFHSGVIIGADGFGFAPQEDNQYMKIPQLGNVVVEDHVDIGANTCIDRSTLGSTLIHKGVKLCNFIQVAHNCEIGENTVMAAMCGISGSTKIGKNCIFGGQVGVNWHLNIGDNVQVGAKSAVTKSFKSNSRVLGIPAFNAEDCIKSFAITQNLPQLYKRLQELEEKVEALEKEKRTASAE